MIEILGSSISALVATERLMAAGVEVRRTPSGKRSPFDFHVLPDGRRVEIGCKLLELSYEPQDWSHYWPELTEYRPGTAHGHRPWIPVISSYVYDAIDVGPEVRALARRGRHASRDPFLSGDPTYFYELLTLAERKDAIRELENVIGVYGPEGGNLRTADTSLREAAQTLGWTIWSGVYWPLLHKIVGWSDLPWWQHRKVWLPLWWPQSLLDALRGEPSYQPVRPMHFGVGALYEALEAVTKDVWEGEGFPEDGWDLYDYNTIIDGIGVDRTPRSVRVGVAWVEDEHPAGVEWLIDPDNPVYRRTWRNGVCCVEYADGADIDRWAYDMSLTVLEKMRVPVPIGDVQTSDRRAIGYGSLNEQILQGLAAADRLIREAS